MTTKRLHLCIIAVECILVIALGVHLAQRYRTSQGASVYTLERESLLFPSRKLKYFYEPKAGSVDRNAEPKWLTYIPRYTINNDALNERFDYALAKPDDVYRIITLGDSFTYGLFVNTPDNWTELLEDKLNASCVSAKYKKFEVINLGYPGYDIEYAVERYRIRGQKYDPDMVIWFLKQDDFDEVTEWQTAQTSLRNAQLEQAKGSATKIGWQDIWNKARQDVVTAFTPQGLTAFQTQALRSLDQYFKKDLLIYSMDGFFKSFSIDNRAIIENAVIERPHADFYLSPVNLHEEGKLFPDGHPNQEGQQIIARDIFTYLTEEDRIPCKK